MRNNVTAAPARDLSVRARAFASRAAVRLNDETGAQAAEYAMLGGVSAAACGGLVTLLKGTDLLESIVSAVVETVVGFIASWF